MGSPTLKFHGFELDIGGYELRRRGRTIKLERIPMELLRLLAERRGELVTRGEIIEKLWGKDIFLDVDSSINTAIRKLRRVLGDEPKYPRFIQTLTGKGYRFVAPVSGAPVAETATERSDFPAARIMLAVLAFENLSQDAEQDYFSDGLTEEIICHLGRIDPERMGVIARTSSMAYKHTTRSIVDIGRELSVDYVLESSVRREGGRFASLRN